MNITDMLKFKDQPNPHMIAEMQRLATEATQFAGEPGLGMMLTMMAFLYANKQLEQLMRMSMQNNPMMQQFQQPAVPEEPAATDENPFRENEDIII
jgi:hypothetical protein